MKVSKHKSPSSKGDRLHRWERLVGIVRWSVEHQVPQTIIKLIMWLGDLFWETDAHTAHTPALLGCGV